MTRTEYIWDENSEPYSSKMGQYKTKIELGFIENALKNFPLNSKVLDVGGGSGRFSKKLINKGFIPKIIDSNEIAIKIARENGIDAECVDFFEYSSVKNFDVILSIEVLSYIENKSLFFEKVHSLLGKNGMFIFTAANPKSWRYILRNSIKSKFKFHEQYLQSYSELLKNYFEIVEIKGFLWQPFSLTSNNIMISFFAKLEKMFFSKLLKQSPWWLFSCLKK
jgi:2-polyprenyl-3-methyl-5-hydroxy-6-metoxy-1,4-benzoquinol methylase